MFRSIAAVTATCALAAPAAAATLLGSYGFDNTLASSTAGAPTLTAIDPTLTNGFSTDTVFGQTRTVYDFNGQATSALNGGLALDSSAITPNSYSVALTLKFDERQGAWRRIIDVSGRQSDAGFYVDPGNNLAIFPTSGSQVNFNSGVYRNVVLTVDGTTVSGFIDGGQSFTTTTTVMGLTGNPIVFFADNVAAGGQNEWSSGSIAALRVYNGVLTAAEIAELNRVPFVEPPVTPPAAVPEPASWAMMIAGFGLVGSAARRRRVMSVRLA